MPWDMIRPKQTSSLWSWTLEKVGFHNFLYSHQHSLKEEHRSFSTLPKHGKGSIDKRSTLLIHRGALTFKTSKDVQNSMQKAWFRLSHDGFFLPNDLGIMKNGGDT
jgi:hypothetical protein